MTSLSAEENEKVKGRWNQEPKGIGIWTFPPVWKHLSKCGFGPEVSQRHADNINWSEDIFIEQCLGGKEVESVLSICCGFGEVERYFVKKLPHVKHCLGIDIADNAIARAREVAGEQGLSHVISYQTADLNNYNWGAGGPYDLVIAVGALHHIANLEAVLGGIKRSLKPDGWLYSAECIGPSLQDHPPRHLEIINAFIYLLPPELRRRWPALRPPSFRQRLARKVGRLIEGKGKNGAGGPGAFSFGIVYDSQKENLLRTDPSEGVRSAEIVGTMKSIFSRVRVHQIGAAVLTYALDGAFFEHYDRDNPLHVGLFEKLCSLEEFLLAQGEVKPEYALLFAQP